jgi:hypothetical protein
MKLNQEIYDSHKPLKLAFNQGRLAMCEEIRELAQMILTTSNINPFSLKNEFEEGQMAALVQIIETCMAIEEAQVKEDKTDIVYDA